MRERERKRKKIEIEEEGRREEMGGREGDFLLFGK